MESQCASLNPRPTGGPDSAEPARELERYGICGDGERRGGSAAVPLLAPEPLSLDR